MQSYCDRYKVGKNFDFNVFISYGGMGKKKYVIFFGRTCIVCIIFFLLLDHYVMKQQNAQQCAGE